MLGRIHGIGTSSIYPPGYKLVTVGEFPGFDGTKRIPLTIKTNGSYTSDRRTIYLSSNLGFIFSSSSWSVVNIDLQSIYEYDFEKLKQIQWIRANEALMNTVVIAWLEKVGA